MVALAGALALGTVATADQRALRARLAAENEVPVVVSAAQGDFSAKLDDSGGAPVITYELSYDGLEGNVLQAHIHAGQPNVNGAIIIWLCSNLASPPTPAGTQPCPAPPALITGTITAADVVGAATQAIPAGSLEDALAAITSGNAYVNVHSSVSPGGELRGQLR
jgi:hypothetical protein